MMRHVLNKMSSSCSDHIKVERFSAVKPICIVPKNMTSSPCRHLNGCCSMNEKRMIQGYTPEKLQELVDGYDKSSGALKRGDKNKIGLIGCWYSHMLLYGMFAFNSTAEYVLVLEDDVVLMPAFFTQLPMMLEAVKEIDPDYDFIRFSTWGGKHAQDEVSKKNGTYKIYDTKQHPYYEQHINWYYGGTHAVLMQRRTAVRAYNTLHDRGIFPIDGALRSNQNTLDQKLGSQPILHSYAIHTSLVKVNTSTNSSIPKGRGPKSQHTPQSKTINLKLTRPGI